MISENEMYFFIADISGYTAFMIKNKKDYAHGNLIIRELIHALIKEVDAPMEVSKLEGDAIFFFLQTSKVSTQMAEQLGEKLLLLFKLFAFKLKELESSTSCHCGGCSNIRELQLKIIVHYGKASLLEIDSFKELSGVDVITAHRLLKNQIKEKTYLLMTEPAKNKLTLPINGKMVRLQEYDKDLGSITIYVYFPEGAAAPFEKKELSFFLKMKSNFKLMIGEVLLKLKIKKDLPFRNLPIPK